ncbi:hypothetical protein DESUT3_04670 [Desulfuromonas versatilis]|uniref:Tetratricopeptide repeat protein n=1 Tax=Desulfuromonas versatilis TaxID=2802975 RepID=A0ABN6DTD2_9BACT|nr:hypothetical protein [Desulfuromonas versatilis]BCR03398.1 hypothetical protein DESUT3_04670 [Desulfuromonas versatilis]
MPSTDFNRLVQQGIAAIRQGNTLMALVHFENAAHQRDTPVVRSYLAYCLARERRQLQKAVHMCMTALQEEPGNSIHTLNLGRIYLIAGQKARAINAFRRGIKLERNQEIIEELKALGVRKSPPLKALDRDHPLNKYLGILSKRFGFR